MPKSLSLWNDGQPWKASAERDPEWLCVSGGGRDFMHPIVREVYGTAPGSAIGSAAASLAYREHGCSAELARCMWGVKERCQ